MITPKENSRHVYTVFEITQGIKSILEETFGQVFVEGEVSNFKAHPNGHFYFSLKDENAVLSAAMFSRANKEVKFKLEDGLKVICFGNIEVYPPHGKYQIIVEKIEPKGIGSLQLALEQLKQKLEKEGLFSQNHKRPIPFLPQNIGLVTASSGAAIKDILKVLDRRFKEAHIIISSVRVQGEGAKEEIAQAIMDFNRFNESVGEQEKIEVMIVGRGGGSIEDLWAFNEELVARAIYNSRIPVIAAVGHERDWTVADLVADLRAATPSAAAELVIARKEDLKERLETLGRDLNNSLLEILSGCRDYLESLSRNLRLLNPASLIPQYKEEISGLARQVYVRMAYFMKMRESELVKFAQKLSALNPLNILGRGYSVTFKFPQAEIIKDSKIVKIGENIRTKLYRGELVSEVREVRKDGGD